MDWIVGTGVIMDSIVKMGTLWVVSFVLRLLEHS